MTDSILNTLNGKIDSQPVNQRIIAMDNAKEKKVIDAIHKAMDSSAECFIIKTDAILVDDESVFSIIVSFTPADDTDSHWEDARCRKQAQPVVFQIEDDDEPIMIIGECTEKEITKANIFEVLYWYETIITPAEAGAQGEAVSYAALKKAYWEFDARVKGMAPYNVPCGNPEHAFAVSVLDVIGSGSAQKSEIPVREPVGGDRYGWEGEYNRGWNDCRDLALAHPQAPAIPEGWKLVKIPAVYSYTTNDGRVWWTHEGSQGGWTHKEEAEESARTSDLEELVSSNPPAPAIPEGWSVTIENFGARERIEIITPKGNRVAFSATSRDHYDNTGKVLCEVADMLSAAPDKQEMGL